MGSLIPTRFAIAIVVGTLYVGPIACRKEAEHPSASVQDKSATSTERSSPAASSSGALSIEAAFRSLLTSWNRVHAVSAKVKTWAQRDIGDRAYSEGKGVYNVRINEGNMRLRYYVKSMIHFWVGDDHYYTPERIEFVSDGKVLEHLVLQHKNRKLFKTRYRPTDVLQIGGRLVIESLRADNKITSMKPEQVDGRDALVFECRSKDGEGSSTHTFDVKTGIRIGWEERNAAGDRVLSVKLSDLNLSPELTEEDLTMIQAKEYTLIDETGPERREIPWEELSKTLPSEDAKTPESQAGDTNDSAESTPERRAD